MLGRLGPHLLRQFKACCSIFGVSRPEAFLGFYLEEASVASEIEEDQKLLLLPSKDQRVRRKECFNMNKASLSSSGTNCAVPNLAASGEVGRVQCQLVTTWPSLCRAGAGPLRQVQDAPFRCVRCGYRAFRRSWCAAPVRRRPMALQLLPMMDKHINWHECWDVAKECS